MKVDCIEAGSGPSVVLVHSSVSGNRQWKRMVEDLKDCFRVFAPNLHGYGATPPWDPSRSQTLADQANLVTKVLPPGDVRIVGHSYGGAVAMKLAAMLGDRAKQLVLLETNPFYLLAQNGRRDAYAEIKAIRDHVKEHGSRGDWLAVAERFADYWNGPGSWQAMPAERREAFARAVLPNYHEWDSVMDESTTLAQWGTIRARTLLVRARETVRPIREIDELLRSAFPAWESARVSEGGHMAPLTHPELVNPIVEGFLAC